MAILREDVQSRRSPRIRRQEIRFDFLEEILRRQAREAAEKGNQSRNRQTPL